MHHFITIVNADPYIPATVLPCNTEAEIDEAAAYLADEGIDSAPIWSGEPEGESVKTHFVVLAEERDDEAEALAGEDEYTLRELEGLRSAAAEESQDDADRLKAERDKLQHANESLRQVARDKDNLQAQILDIRRIVATLPGSTVLARRMPSAVAVRELAERASHVDTLRSKIAEMAALTAELAEAKSSKAKLDEVPAIAMTAQEHITSLACLMSAHLSSAKLLVLCGVNTSALVSRISADRSAAAAHLAALDDAAIKAERGSGVNVDFAGSSASFEKMDEELRRLVGRGFKRIWGDEDEPAPAPVVYSQQDLADAAKGLGYSLISSDLIHTVLSTEERMGFSVLLTAGLFISFDGAGVAYDDMERLIKQGIVSRRTVEDELMGAVELPRHFYRLVGDRIPASND